MFFINYVKTNYRNKSYTYDKNIIGLTFKNKIMNNKDYRNTPKKHIIDLLYFRK